MGVLKDVKYEKNLGECIVALFLFKIKNFHVKMFDEFCRRPIKGHEEMFKLNV